MKEFLFRQLSLDKNPSLSILTKIIYIVIFVSIFFVVIETEPSISNNYKHFFFNVNMFFGSFFVFEYLLRLYAVGLDKRYSGFKGRIFYIFTPFSLIDLLAIIPAFIFPGSSESFLLRLFRVLRIFSILRTSKNTEGLRLIIKVFMNKKYELLYSLLITLSLIFISAVLLYLAEGGIQKEAFGSIPRSLWWAVTTLTTVGYGDIYPITAIGRILTIFITITGIGVVAIPTGILAGGFSEILSQSKDKSNLG